MRARSQVSWRLSLLTLNSYFVCLHPHSPFNAGDNSTVAADGISVASADLSPDTSASAVISSPVTGLLPELTPADLADGVLLFLLQVSGASAVINNSNLNWALSVNLATRLEYVSVDNLYLLNYTQLPPSSRRRLLADAPLSAAELSPSNIGEAQAGVVALPDLQTQIQTLSQDGTGILTHNPSMTFMYEVQVSDTSYISYIHNQLNSIIATSLLLKDVQAANLSISSIYLLSFEPSQSATAANTTSVSLSTPPSGRPSHKTLFLTTILVPVALLLVIFTGTFVIWRRHLRRQKGIFETQPSLDPSDIAQGISLQMADASLLDSKALTGSMLSSQDSFSHEVSEQQESMISSEVEPAMPPLWIDNVPFSDWEIDVSDVVIGLRPDGRKWELGAGAFSRVYRGLLRGVQVVAVKVFNDGPQYTSDSSQERLQTLQVLKQQRETLIRQEIAVLKSCRDHNIVQFVGACIQREQTMLITEFMEGGDLYHAIARDTLGRFAWSVPDGPQLPGLGRRIALDVARGLHFLHSRKIVHFDLKSANILLARDNTAKIADVGLAKIMHRQFLSSLYNVGTFAWSAPEVLLGKSTCTEKVDIYSYGVVLWEICAGEAPDGRQLRPLRVPEECPQATADVVEQCLHEDPNVRPSAREIVERLSQIREPTQ
ncbi:MAG: cytochrome P450 [Trebouxia sp. A1-2]|nr:MAG: cytochrome P450 [Trebouxia sp. A1-2]